jgi:LPXTG-motif cell wall-anchored protein
MITLAIAFFATTTVPQPVPDAGSAGLLLGLGVLSLGAVAHLLRKRKK